MSNREIITFEDTDEVFNVMAKDERFIIGVRPYTVEESEREQKEWDSKLESILREEYDIHKKNYPYQYECFEHWEDEEQDAGDIQSHYIQENGEQPETISEDTFCYTLIDLKENIRSSDNYYCKFDYDKQEECDKALIELNNGDMQLSRRNKVELKIKEIK